MTEPVCCVRCGKTLLKNDIGLTRKMVNRGATEFYCISCLSDHFQIPEVTLHEKIKEFKEMGCTLFE